MIRLTMFIVLGLAAAPAIAREDMPLSPVGLPFSPATPRVVPTDHPLHGSIRLVGIDALPDKLGPVKRDAFAAAVTDTLKRLDMLAADTSKARFRLTPIWIGLDSPFRISATSRAASHLVWRLTRIDDGRTIFEREITTSVQSSGGSAPERKRGVERLSLMSNIASVALCLDKSAYGRAPADCALTPGFSYRAPSVPMITFLRR